MTEDNDTATASGAAVLVTGGSGLIGSRLVERLAEDYPVFSLDIQRPERHLPRNATFVPIDLTSDQNVADSIGECWQRSGRNFAALIHLAAYYDFTGEPSELYEQVTVRGTQRLLRAVSDVQLHQFLFTSSMLVHKPSRPGVKINERWPLKPKWDYPRSKVATEQLIAREHRDLPYVILRVAGVYDDVCHSLPLAHQIDRIYNHTLTSHLFPGDISHGQAFVHIDDVVEAIRLAIVRRDALPQRTVLLIGEPQTYSYDEVQRTLGRLIHGEANWQTRHIPKAVAKTGSWMQNQVPGLEDPFIKPWMIDMADDHYELDIARAQAMLGWSPKRRLIDTLAKMVANLRVDPVGWFQEHDLHAPRARHQAG